MFFQQIESPGMQNFAYIVADEKSREAVIVDPSGIPSRILELCSEKGLNPRYVINTHSHFDHIQGNDEIIRKTGAKLAAHKSVKYRIDVKLDDGGVLEFGALKITVIHTPGHTPDSICLLIGNKLITGDTLFVGECGRTDLPGSDPVAMWQSLLNKLASLPEDTEVWPGHDYGDKPHSTIGYEKTHNYVLKPRTKDEFIRFMSEP